MVGRRNVAYAQTRRLGLRAVRSGNSDSAPSWPSLPTPGWLGRQAKCCWQNYTGTAREPFYPNHFLTWQAAAALQRH